MNSQQYLDSLTAQGKISFTLDQLKSDLALSSNAAACLLRKLKKKGYIASPAKGYYLIITPEFRRLGCLPPDFFIHDLMQYLKLDYHVALLSAALYHGAAHQQPQIFQVIIPKVHKDIQCGRVHIKFIRNQFLKDNPRQELKTRTGIMQISTPEATAKDLLTFISQSGGLGQIATVIHELAETLNGDKLMLLAKHSKQKQWIQRLGYMLDNLGHITLAKSLYKVIKDEKLRIIALVPNRNMVGVIRDMKWRIAINAEIESDLKDDTT